MDKYPTGGQASDFAAVFSGIVGGVMARDEIELCMRKLGFPEGGAAYAVAEFVVVGGERRRSGGAKPAFSSDEVNREFNSIACEDISMAAGRFLHDISALIVLQNPPDDDNMKKLRAVFVELMRRLSFNTGLMLQCRISSFGSTPEELSEVYVQIKELSDFLALLDKTDPLYIYDETSKLNPWGKNEIFGLEARYTRLLSALSVNDFPTAQQILNQMLDEDFFDASWTIQMTYVMKYSMLNYIRITMEHMKMVVGPDFFVSPPKNLWSIVYRSSISEIRIEMNDLFESYYDYIDRIKNGTGPLWNSTLKEYICQQLGNPELTVVSIAERMGLNPAYMGRIFKKYNNQQLMDYIHRLRIEKAVSLMDEGLTLGKIAREVGYDNTRRFCQVFKRYTGQTPSAIRQQRLRAEEI